jgi:putative oxidoreductase
MRLLTWLLHLVYGGCFLWAGVVKALAPLTFLDDIRSYELLPDPYAAAVALSLPWLEILAGMAVITALLRPGGLLLLQLCLLTFLAAIISAWWRGLDIRCGCFGSQPDGMTSNYLWLISRDVALFLLGAWLQWRGRPGLAKPPERHLPS